MKKSKLLIGALLLSSAFAFTSCQIGGGDTPSQTSIPGETSSTPESTPTSTTTSTQTTTSTPAPTSTTTSTPTTTSTTTSTPTTTSTQTTPTTSSTSTATSTSTSTTTATSTTTLTYTVEFTTTTTATIDAQTVEAGGKVTKPTDPTKAATAEFTYAFEGWYKDQALTQKYDFDSAVNSNLHLYAKFTETKNQYKVTFLNDDDTEVSKEDIAYGAQIVAPETNPTKAATAEFTYTFDGWYTAKTGGEKVNTFPTVSAAVTYYARYTVTKNQYTYTFFDEDGQTELKVPTTVDYGTVIVAPTNPTKAATAQYTYAFDGWYTEKTGGTKVTTFEGITSNVTYYARYTETARTYTVTWKNYDGTVLETDTNVEYNADPKFNRETPTKDLNDGKTYSFFGWSPTESKVTSDQEYVAQFVDADATFTLYWVNYNDDVLETDTNVHIGDNIEYNGVTPTKPATAQYSYVFKSWATSIDNVAMTITNKAQFDEVINQYTYTFYADNGTTSLKSLEVDYGTQIVAPSNPTKDSTAEFTYAFEGWYTAVSGGTKITEFPTITENVTYYARFNSTVREYTITWKNDDNSIIDTTSVAYGTTPTHANPSKAATAEYTYTFSEWTPEVASVTGEATYKATYNSVKNKYTYTFYDEDGTTPLKALNVDYGTQIEAPTNPTKADDSTYTYSFDGWYTSVTGGTKVTSFSTIISNVKYYARYTATPISSSGISVDTALQFHNNGSGVSNVVEWADNTAAGTLSGFTVTGTSSDLFNSSYLSFKNTVTVSFDLSIPSGKTASLVVSYYSDEEGTVKIDSGSAISGTKSSNSSSSNYIYEYSLTTSGNVVLSATTTQNYLNWIAIVFENSSTPATTYSITYVTEHGTAPANKTNVTEITSSDLAAISADGYLFGGWYTNEARTAAATAGALSDNVTLYAKWTAVDSNTITTNTVYSFKGYKVVSDSDILFTGSGEGAAPFTESKLTVDTSSGKFVSNGGGWYQINKNTILSFTTAQAVSIDITAYSASFACTIVGPGLNQSVSGASISVVTNAGGTVTITVTESDYLGLLEITNRDMSKQADSIDLHLITTAAAATTTAGNGSYKVYNAKTIYKIGESFDPSGVYGVIGYTSGDDDVATANSGLVFTGFSSATAGKKTITVSYTSGGETVSATYDVYVISTAPSIVSSVLQVKVNPSYSGTLGDVVGGYNMFKTINQALDYLRSYEDTYTNSSKLLYVTSGTYKEKLYIDIPNLTIRGANKTNTIIEYDSLYYNSAYANITGYKAVSIDPNGFEHVTDSTQTMTIAEAATNCTLYDLTISNKWNSMSAFTTAFGTNNIEHRALAMLIYADKVVVQDCRLLGYQDTLEAMTGRSYFYKSYISGTVDFIFGTNPTMYFEECEIHSIDNGSTDGGYINAFKGANKVQSDGSATDYVTYGAIYNKCTFTADSAITSSNTSIARPWAKYSAVMIMNSTIGGHISTTAYSATLVKNARYVSWGTSSSSPKADDSSIKHLEYNNTGDGRITATQSGVVVLTDSTEAAKYSNYAYIFGTTNGGITYDDAWVPTIITESTTHTITISQSSGYVEGAYVEFETTADTLVASYKKSTDSDYTTINSNLVRMSNGVGRVDVVGLSAGTYSVKLVDSSDSTVVAEANNLTVTADDRSGYAHFDNSTHTARSVAVGAYNIDGTLKDNAVVVYVTDANKNTVTAEIGGVNYTGLANIIKNSDSSIPLDIRVIGSIKTTQWNTLTYTKAAKSSSLFDEQTASLSGLTPSDGKIMASAIISNGNNSYSDDLYNGITTLDGLTSYISVKSSEYDTYWNMMDVSRSNITIEGIGINAEIFQWGFTFSSCDSIEVKNLTFNDYTEDAIGIQGASNTDIDYGNFWIHNCTFNIGVNHWDLSYEKDKGDGDGATDFKRAHNLTISYCRYNGTHKTNLIGANDDCPQYNITLHHNYYNGCQSRLPLIRMANVHIYNNYFKGTTSVSSSIRAKSTAFIESNYYEGGQNPFMLVPKTDYVSAGTSIKAINNVYNGSISTSNNSSSGYYYKTDGIYVVQDDKTTVTTQTTSPTRTTSVEYPTGVTNDYANFDTDTTLFYYDDSNHKSDVKLDDASSLSSDIPNVAGANVCGGTFEQSFLDEVNLTKYTISYVTNDSNYSVSSKNSYVLTTDMLSELDTADAFAGWYLDSNLENKAHTGIIEDDVTLYGKWYEKYSVTYVSNDHGTAPSNTTAYELTSAMLPILSETGYSFGGWYTDSGFNNVAEPGLLTAPITLYAKWTDTSSITTYSMNFNDGNIIDENGFFTVSGDGATTSTNTGSLVYNETTYTKTLKFDSKPTLSFTTTKSFKLTLVCGNSETLKINGTSYTPNSNNIIIVDNLTSGNYSIVKGSAQGYLYLIIVECYN